MMRLSTVNERNMLVKAFAPSWPGRLETINAPFKLLGTDFFVANEAHKRSGVLEAYLPSVLRYSCHCSDFNTPPLRGVASWILFFRLTPFVPFLLHTAHDFRGISGTTAVAVRIHRCSTHPEGSIRGYCSGAGAILVPLTPCQLLDLWQGKSWMRRFRPRGRIPLTLCIASLFIKTIIKNEMKAFHHFMEGVFINVCGFRGTAAVLLLRLGMAYAMRLQPGNESFVLSVQAPQSLPEAAVFPMGAEEFRETVNYADVRAFSLKANLRQAQISDITLASEKRSSPSLEKAAASVRSENSPSTSLKEAAAPLVEVSESVIDPVGSEEVANTTGTAGSDTAPEFDYSNFSRMLASMLVLREGGIAEATRAIPGLSAETFNYLGTQVRPHSP